MLRLHWLLVAGFLIALPALAQDATANGMGDAFSATATTPSYKIVGYYPQWGI